MITSFQLTWKVSGLLPGPTENLAKYFLIADDKNYQKRVFDCPELPINSQSLVPTKLFHQALDAELRRKHELRIGLTGNPIRIPIKNLGFCLINLRFRIFENSVLILTIETQEFSKQLSALELISLQMLSSHPILESIARFCFNVHYAPSPSDFEVKAFQSKPLIRLQSDQASATKSELAEIVTRHTNLNKRAIKELFRKNESLNFNDDLALIDKQGVVFLEITADHTNQRNRFTRISALCEYALYASTILSAAAEKTYEPIDSVTDEINAINKVIKTEVLSKSVSAKRAWSLIKIELGLRKIALPNIPDNALRDAKQERIHFYKNPIFIGASALIALGVGIIRLIQYLKGI